MTVSELIAFLEKQPQDLPVAYEFCSDYALLDAGDISIRELGILRNDGYIHGKRPDQATEKYLVFPGN